MNISHKEIIELGKYDKFNRFIKRTFDIIISFIGIIVVSPIILISVLLVRILYNESGFFIQRRIRKYGKEFNIIKIKTMSSNIGYKTNVTTDNDPRITPLGRFFRKTKIDELPQLYNVLIGNMSFVGPRPDIKELVDTIENRKKSIFLSIRPGITGPASLKYKDEEKILAEVESPEMYNKEIIFPDKVKINEEYIRNYSIINDIKYIISTIL